MRPNNTRVYTHMNTSGHSCFDPQKCTRRAEPAHIIIITITAILCLVFPPRCAQRCSITDAKKLPSFFEKLFLNCFMFGLDDVFFLSTRLTTQASPTCRRIRATSLSRETTGERPPTCLSTSPPPRLLYSRGSRRRRYSCRKKGCPRPTYSCLCVNPPPPSPPPLSRERGL